MSPSLLVMISHVSSTLPVTAISDIYSMAFSTDGSQLLVVDELGTVMLINYAKRVLLSTMRLSSKAHDIKFSPDGKFFAAAVDKTVEV